MTKQKFFRVSSYGDTTPTTIAQNQLTLYEAEEACTMRRLIIFLTANNNNTTVSETFWRIVVCPNGVIPTDELESTTVVTGEQMPQEYIGGGVLASGNYIKFDTKGMRKMRKGDQIKLLNREGTDAGTSELRWYADIFLSQ